LNDFVQDDFLRWQAPTSSDYRVYVFSRKYLTSGLFFGSAVDTLNPEAIKRFIELTHQEYAKRFKTEFGSTVWGIFTDEPAMDYNPQEAIPWTANLPSLFERRYGYSLYKALPALFEDVGPLTPMVRAHFRDTATEAYVNAFFKQIYEFCDKVNLNFVGHVLSEGELYYHTRHQGDFFRGAQYMHFGGVDFLCELTWPQKDTPWGLNNLVGPKFASSAAHLLEKPRVMSEAFGLASQWGISLSTLKWLADWQIALGVNLIMPHAFYYSIQGFRKWECPPDEFYRAPFWKYYKKFADYIARLCYIFSGGSHIADVAFLYPIKSMWASINPQPTKETEKIMLGFNKTSEALLRIGFDFDYVSEEILQQRTLFQRGRIWIMDESCSEVLEEYKILLLPTLTMLSWETVEVIEDYLEEGGKVIALGSLPHSSFEAGEDEEILERLSFLFGVKPEEARLNPDGMEKKVYRKKHEKGEAIFIRGAHDLPQEELEEILFSLLKEAIEPDALVLEDGKPARDILTLHYVKAGRSFYFFVNTSRQRSVEFQAELSEGGIPLVWNAET
ncbi:MAG: glycosyl hydrolase, partial [bacterium]